MRPFVSLLREALEVAQQREGTAGLSLSESFRSAAREHLRLTQGLEDTQDRVAKALALGRQALWALAQGRQEEACRLLREAVELHPELGSGFALKLAAQLCEEERALLEEKIQRLEAKWAEAPQALRLLRALAELPTEVWKDFFQPRRISRFRENRKLQENREPKEEWAAPRERVSLPKQRSPRPSWLEPIHFLLRYRGWKGSEAEGRSRRFEGALLFSLTQSQLGFLGEDEGIHLWRDREKLIRLESEGDFSTLRISEALFQAALGWLLVLEGSLGTLLLPLIPSIATKLQLPPLAEPGEDIQAELWSWESLTPKDFQSLYRRATYRPVQALRNWLWLWLRQDQTLAEEELEEWLRILERLLR